MTAVAPEVHRLLRQHVTLEETTLDDDSQLVDLGIASLDVIEIVFALEERFDIILPFEANDADKNSQMTVGDLVEMVQRELPAPAA